MEFALSVLAAKGSCGGGISLILWIIAAVLVIGALVLLSTLPKQQPTHPIEVAVPAPGGNAH